MIINSKRINRLPPYLFGRLKQMTLERRRQGIDVIDLSMGNPDRPTPDHIIQKMCEAVQDPKNHRYSASKGIYNLRREVSWFYDRRFNVDIDPNDEVIAVIGTKEGLSHLALALIDEGDVALVPNPTYPIHIYSIIIAGGNVMSIPMDNIDNFLPNLSEITKELWPRPKLLLLNFPHNPTTATVELGFFEDVVKFAKKNDMIVVHDLAYLDIVFDGYVAPSFLQAKGAKDIGVEFISMSKSYNMAGWRCGFAVGNKDIIDALAKIKGYYDYGIFAPIQIASILALRESDEHAKENALTYQSRRDVLVNGLNRIGWKVEKPKATMFVWAPIPEKFKSMGSMNFALKLLEEAEVCVSPGIGFGDKGEGYIRLALVENELRIKQAVRQIRKALMSDTPTNINGEKNV
ncbi:TPA: aminotransferase class I/II-fold pyridoxal phosphate-dependent enzyme [Candidatus Poribacteria bacterium]|nr:aminotransferase class I/II-fold pyridoxal phosphate-dependent enzyme [Candidatus Poribacteria bacterium]